MLNLRTVVRHLVDARVRDSIWALRTRGDATVLSTVMRGSLKIPYETGSSQAHLKSTFQWLCAAQDATPVGGVCAFYDVRAGQWGPLYPETTGYLIPTFCEYAVFSNDPAYQTRALRMADWLLTLQLESGAFPIGPLWPDWKRTPIIFDTGQILQGLVRAFEATGYSGYLAAAQRAGAWLVDVQDANGGWSRFTPLDYANTYNARTAWALLQLHRVSPEGEYHSSAIRNLSWVLTQQMPDGWFLNAGFTPEEAPLTHTIAYTIEGLLEAGLLLSDARLVTAAQVAADALRERQAQTGYLQARYGSGWQPPVRWSCLTGNAQMAAIWFKLYELTHDEAYVQAANVANHSVKQTQQRHSKWSGVVGGIAGSYPIYGGYEPYRHLNWAAKFFADSLLLQERLHVNGNFKTGPSQPLDAHRLKR